MSELRFDQLHALPFLPKSEQEDGEELGGVTGGAGDEQEEAAEAERKRRQRRRGSQERSRSCYFRPNARGSLR